jgi:hypothetical protein
MARICCILAIGAALVTACGVESAPDELSPVITPRNLDDSRCSLVPKPQADCVCAGPNRWVCPEPTGGIICPVLPPDCCIIRIVSGCRVCAQTGC